MVNLSFQDNSIIFTFEDSQHYLQGNGVIEAPKGSLALVTDETNMANFVKAGSNDIFVSATYEELGMTKDELLETFAANAGSSGGGGEGGLTPEEAQEMIDESISGKADTSAVTTELADKLDISDFNTYSASTDSTIASKADASDLSALEDVVDTKANDSDLQALESVVGDKLDTSDFNTYSAATESTLSGKADTTAMTTALADKLDVSAFNTYSGDIDTAIAAKASQTDLETVSGNVNTLSGDVANKVDSSAYTAYTSATDTAIASKASQTDLNTVSGDVNTLSGQVANKVDTSAYTAYTSATDSAIASKASNTDLQSVSGVVDTKLATSDFNTYSASVDTTIASKADTTAMTQALSTKQDTLVSGTNIKTINNTSILGSGNIEIQVEVDDELDIDSPNAVANSAITKAIQDNELVTANALIALQEDLDDKASQTDLNTVSAATASNTTALGGYKLAKMTTAEYEALTVKDASTIYFIVD